MIRPLYSVDEKATVRAVAGQRQRRLHRYFEASCDAVPDAIALETESEWLTYRQLDERANQLAHLVAGRVSPGERVGILLHRSTETYVALLALQKASTTFVPIDPAAPAERVAYISADAGLALLLSSSETSASAHAVGCQVLELDAVAEELEHAPVERPAIAEESDPSCYVIYTSGSSGRPKGVEIAQSSICNFIEVVRGLYQVSPIDRVYQGMSISFDFSIEEIWPTWAAGATLVAGPSDHRSLADGLAQFLAERDVTMLYCVPTVLASIQAEVPGIHTLVVGGEACPAEIVERWSRPGRRMLNTYGPTEATVTATVAELKAGQPVTIGRPLPSYQVVLLDDDQNLVSDGEVGEICIGGPGVARGYVNRPDLTAERFLNHPLITGEQRLYRTGDLGRMLPNGEIVYLGRTDSEVKIRGRRVDLGEIDSVLLEDDAVAAAATVLLAQGELAGYVTRRGARSEPDDAAVVTRLHEALRNRLPPYMVPAFLEVIDELPLMASGKVDRSNLPAPTGGRLITSEAPHVSPSSPLQQQMVAIWAEVLGLGSGNVSVEADFFLDLGGHSLLAAQVISRLRGDGIAPQLSVGDLYARPSIRALAQHAATLADIAVCPPQDRPVPRRPGAGRVTAAGSTQFGMLYLLLLIFGAPAAVVLGLADGVLSLATLWWLAATTPVGYVLGRLLVPPLAARLLSRGLRPGRYPLWGATYLRLWLLDKLMAGSLAGLLSGSPLLPPYLRLLGGRIGRRCHIATASLSLPWLLDIGDDVSIGYGAQLRSVTVEEGWVTVKPVVVGDRAFVGANAVLQPGASLGADAGLAEQSLAAEDQHIPAREHWVGSPSMPSSEPDPVLESIRCRSVPQTRWSRWLLVGYGADALVLELLPFVIAAPVVALIWISLLLAGPVTALMLGFLAGPLYVLSACWVIGLGKQLVLASTPPGVHPLRSSLGLRKWLTDKLLAASLVSTNSLYATLYAVPWLRALGAKVGPRSEVSTASQLDPDLLTLGTESFVADMASVGSAVYHHGYFMVDHTKVGRRSFVGNAALLRAGTTLGDNSLIGVHTTAPAGGVPAGTSWLGSPPIHLPRRQSSEGFDDDLTFRPSRRRVAGRLAIEFVRVTLPATLVTLAVLLGLLTAAWVAARFGVVGALFGLPAVALLAGLMVVVTVAALKWVIVGRYRTRVEPLWSMFVRRTELVTGLYESAAVLALLAGLTGTPMLGVLLRLFGARVGSRSCLATTHLTEFDLVRLGEDVTVGAGSSLQTHLFEDRVMKMSTVTIESSATVSARSVVLYDAVVGSDSTLDALSLLMKGERLEPGTRWRGIPCQAMGQADAQAGGLRRAA
jgi:non-ribosomal peptide synthetase-like protein